MMPYPDTRKRRNIERCVWHIEHGESRLDSFPLEYLFGVTTHCNLSCPMCIRTFADPLTLRDEGHLPYELFERTKPHLDAAVRCVLAGLGEPLLYPDLFRILAECKRFGARVHAITNGTVLTGAVSERLVAGGLDGLTVSVDGATKEVYEGVRVGADFERVIENLKALDERKRKAGRAAPAVVLQMTLMKRNLGDLGGIAAVAKRCGVGHVVVEPLTSIWRRSGAYREFFEAEFVPPALGRAGVGMARDRAGALGIGFTSSYLAGAAEEARGPRVCTQPWTTFMLAGNGEVVSCCGGIHVVGNLASQSFDAVWNGPGYRHLREELAAGRSPESCKACLAENLFNRDSIPELSSLLA